MAKISDLNQELAIVQAFDLILQALKVSLAGVTTTNVSGKDSLDVNVTNIAINAADDSVAIKSPTTGNSFEPNSDGSIKATELEGLIQVLNSLTNALMKNQMQMDQSQRPMMRINSIDSNLTLTNLSNINNFVGGNTSGIPYQIGAAATHIYDNIKIT